MEKLEIKTFTVAEVVAAIEENGFDHLRNEWYHKTHGGKLTGGCVLAQGGINLNAAFHDELPTYAQFLPDMPMIPEVHSPSAWSAYNKKREARDKKEDALIKKIGKYNLFQQLNKFTVSRNSRWYLDGYEAGETIITWNDHKTNRKYTLPTYSDVVNMVKEVLAPHMKKTVRLIVVDYSVWKPKRKQNAGS